MISKVILNEKNPKITPSQAQSIYSGFPALLAVVSLHSSYIKKPSPVLPKLGRNSYLPPSLFTTMIFVNAASIQYF